MAGQKRAIAGVFESFYAALSGRFGTGLQPNMWEGPKPIIIAQLDSEPLPPQVAQSIINMLVAILKTKPEPYARMLAQDGALEALYDVAFDHGARLDQLQFDRLPPLQAVQMPAAALVRCCLTSEPLAALSEPVLICSGQQVHLFDFPALKAVWRESFRLTNPMTRQPVPITSLFRLAH